MEAALPSPRLLVLEGADGAGKTTCRRLVFQALARRGRPPLALPGVSWADVESTEILTKARFLRAGFEPSAILAALVEDRRRLGERLIVPALKERDVVLDRYLYSDLVHALVDHGVAIDATASALRAARLPEPDRLLFLDTPPEVAMERLLARGRPLHPWETLDQERRVHEAFQRLLTDNPLGWSCAPEVVDATRGPDAVAADRLLGSRSDGRGSAT